MSRVAALVAVVIACASAAAIDLDFAMATPASSARPDDTHRSGKSILVVRAPRAPNIDGRLTDAVWTDAPFISDFRQRQPIENGEPTRRTEIAFAYDSEALYVAARMFIEGPQDVQAVMTRQDVTGAAERIIVSLDTFRDRRTAYSFAVTAAGVRADWFHPDDDTHQRDRSFDPVWQARVTMAADRWSAEMRIPFSQLRFPASDEQRWGININRYIPQRNEDIFWIAMPKNTRNWASHFGELRGIRGIRSPVRIELLPYVAGSGTLTSSSLTEGDPFVDELGTEARVGLDAKIGLGPNLTLDATVNPDFGQVEADPAEVNLSAFETFFEEQRPFFVEGARLLEGSGSNFFYSRRIGAAPRGSLPEDVTAADVPTTSPILGALKLTGRLPSRLSIGALSAITRRTHADVAILDPETGNELRDEVAVEPLTAFNVVRVEQELGAHSSRVGGTLTGVYRDLEGDEDLADQLVRYAVTGGVDWNLRFADARYEITGDLGFSTIGGAAEAVAQRQLSSAHYYQRPDQDHVEFDPRRRSLLGWRAGLGGGRRSGAWQWSGLFEAESPGFDLNDVGLLRSADDLAFIGDVNYSHAEPSDLLHEWSVRLLGFQEWNFGGVRKPGAINLLGSATLPNFWRLSAGSRLGFPGQNDDLTRGGQLVGRDWAAGGDVSISNSFSSRQRWQVAVGADWGDVGLAGVFALASITLRPVDRLELSLTPSYFYRRDNRQYIDTITGTGQATAGDRYVFAEVERHELVMQTRLQVVFTPDLAVELYAEPFASSGRFSRFGELPESASRDLRFYGEASNTDIVGLDGVYSVTDGDDSFQVSNPDFTALSLRSTLVLRWELLPGSTLFLVWQQNRGESLAVGSPVSIGDLGESITSPGQHTVAVKLSYWWPTGL